MGLIVAAFDAISGNLGDQWLDVIEAADMSEGIVMTKGVAVRRGEKRNNNRKGSSDIVSNGSVIHVNQNQFMMLVDGGKIVDYSAEPGYFKVDNSSMPSLFNGEFKDSLIDAWNRFKFSGTPSQKQEVYFINLQEIKGIKFGTPNPLQYFDNFYNAELFVRSFGNYSIKITDPIKFFQEVCPRNTAQVHINDVNEQYLSEFLEALQASINQMSIDGTRISHLPSKGRELSQFMAQTLDDSWKEIRGMEVLSVGIASISYDDESKEIINMRNKGAVLTDPVIREGFVQGSIARGMSRRQQRSRSRHFVYGHGHWHGGRRRLYGAIIANQFTTNANATTTSPSNATNHCQRMAMCVRSEKQRQILRLVWYAKT